MGKQAQRKKNNAPTKKASPVPWIIAAIAVVAAVLAATGNIPFMGSKAEAGKSFNLTGKETRPVLNPSMFSGQVRMAYAAAKKYPEILNEVFCYCYCDAAPFNHKTLLSCFTDKHGAG
jgi:hypothetical protein